MLMSAPYSAQNALLAGLPGDVLSAMRPFLTRVRLVSGQVLVEAGASAEHVFFPEEGIVSLVADIRGGQSGVQVAMIGREGMVGGLALLGHGSVAYASAVSQIPGPAYRITVTALQRLLLNHPPLHDTCMLFLQSLARQLMENAAFNASESLTRRCVRWLLMADERRDGHELSITHATLSTILGVRRASVTIAMMALQEAGLVRATRGRLTIIDRAALERFLYAEKPFNGERGYDSTGTLAASPA